MRDYRHEELIEGKESMKYVCNGAGKCGQKGCDGAKPHGKCGADFYCHAAEGQVKCIPVEPERVKWYYRMSCATRSCAANDEGMCNVSINGLATCSKHQWPKPSPGLLQRMGMATWPSEARDWFCISQFWPSAHSMTETEAKEMCRGESLRAFRWSDGVQG